MVAGYQNQCLLRMLVCKIHCYLYSVRHCQSIRHSCARIIRMTGPVDLSALTHQKETILIFQYFNALCHIVSQCPLSVLAVHIISHRIGIGQMLIDQEHLAVLCSHFLCILLGKSHLVACRLCQFVEACLILVITGDLL